MHEKGFIVIGRKIIGSRWFPDPRAFKVFVWLILKARWKDGFIAWDTGRGLVTIELRRGQLITGRHKAGEELGLPASTFYSLIKKMEKAGSITIEPFNTHSIITVTNYEKYQNIENFSKGDGEEILPKKKRAGQNHSFKTVINRKTIEEKKVELKEAIYSFAGNFNKQVLDEAYIHLSQHSYNNLDLLHENLVNFSLRVYLNGKQVAFDNRNKGKLS